MLCQRLQYGALASTVRQLVSVSGATASSPCWTVCLHCTLTAENSPKFKTTLTLLVRY